MPILDIDAARSAFNIGSDEPIAPRITEMVWQRPGNPAADSRHYVTQFVTAALESNDYADLRCFGSRSYRTAKALACYCGYDPTKLPREGYEPPAPPLEYQEDPVAFTAKAIGFAIDLVQHPDGEEAVAFRMIADIALATRNRLHTLVDAGRLEYRRYDPEIARIRRIAEVFATPREEKP